MNDGELDFTNEIIVDNELSAVEKLELLENNGLDLEDIVDELI